MFHLVEQELNITERDPAYLNPYRNAVHAGQREDSIKKKSMKKEKRKKGPQIAKIELWALPMIARFLRPVPKSPH